MRGDVKSLKFANTANKVLAMLQATAQKSAHQSLADRIGSLLATGTGAAVQRLQTLQQPQLTEDQLWCMLSKLREDLKSKDAELDAVLASLKGVRHPASSSSLQSFVDLLLQV